VDMTKAFGEIEPGECRSLGNEPQMSENRRAIVVSICAQGRHLRYARQLRSRTDRRK
jgi:hypothetical protein